MTEAESTPIVINSEGTYIFYQPRLKRSKMANYIECCVCVFIIASYSPSRVTTSGEWTDYALAKRKSPNDWSLCCIALDFNKLILEFSIKGT